MSPRLRLVGVGNVRRNWQHLVHYRFQSALQEIKIKPTKEKRTLSFILLADYMCLCHPGHELRTPIPNLVYDFSSRWKKSTINYCFQIYAFVSHSKLTSLRNPLAWAKNKFTRIRQIQILFLTITQFQRIKKYFQPLRWYHYVNQTWTAVKQIQSTPDVFFLSKCCFWQFWKSFWGCVKVKPALKRRFGTNSSCLKRLEVVLMLWNRSKQSCRKKKVRFNLVSYVCRYK